jgi:DNA-binding PadR family transcriptional regulator
MTKLTVLQGTLDVLVLRTLSGQPRHGYAVSHEIPDRTGAVIEIEDTALYRALHRLAAARFVSTEWGISDNNRRARYYG